MKLLTLDTNIVRDALEPGRPHHHEAQALIALDKAGACEIRVVSRFDADVPQGDVRTQFEGLIIAQRPRIQTIGQWDISLWDSDFWATDEQSQLFSDLFKLIFPKVERGSKKSRQRTIDIGHLVGHHRAERDVFVTRDRAILQQQATLRDEFGIEVMSAPDALALCPALP